MIKSSDEPLPPGVDGVLFERFIAAKIVTLATLLKRSSSARFQNKYGLAVAEWRVLTRIGASQPLSLGELANHMGLAASQISRVTSKLVDRGLVVRTQNPKSRRQAEVRLSQRGQELHREIIALGIKRNADLLEGIDPDLFQAGERLVDLLTCRVRELFASEQKATLQGREASGKPYDFWLE